MIQWTRELATGVAEIDADHRELYAHVAVLIEAMRKNRLEVARQTLAFLDRYASEHFAVEERIMETRGYAGLPAHRALHQEFAAQLARRKAEFRDAGLRPSLVVELSSWLTAWLGDHVRQADQDLGRFLSSRPER